MDSEGKRRISHDIWVVWHLYLSTEFIPETESLVVLKKKKLAVFNILLFKHLWSSYLHLTCLERYYGTCQNEEDIIPVLKKFIVW